ncbi:hypothetical protein HMPREF9530_02722 [Escherichia coli MS 21-1]|nr:hypothetical protein [Escherichia coli]EFK20672.1 hypothetical protein HMPREF9530_02722 [Escherichia coli MS 21-1]EFQ0015119.1 hypothetical protein [Shigella flexneri]
MAKGCRFRHGWPSYDGLFYSGTNLKSLPTAFFPHPLRNNARRNISSPFCKRIYT